MDPSVAMESMVTSSHLISWLEGKKIFDKYVCLSMYVNKGKVYNCMKKHLLTQVALVLHFTELILAAFRHAHINTG